MNKIQNRLNKCKLSVGISKALVKKTNCLKAATILAFGRITYLILFYRLVILLYDKIQYYFSYE